MVALLLERGIEAICNRAMEDWMWESAYCIGWVDVGRERSNCCKGNFWLDIGPPLSCHLSLSLNSWTQCIALKKWITFYLVCHLELGT